jgi:hypothetical protein
MEAALLLVKVQAMEAVRLPAMALQMAPQETAVPPTAQVMQAAQEARAAAHPVVPVVVPAVVHLVV